MTGVFPQRPLVDSWSRGRQYRLHRVQYHYILTWTAIASMVAYVNTFIRDTADVVLKQTYSLNFAQEKCSVIVSDMAL